MPLPYGNEELPTTEELANIPVLKDKDVDPGSLDYCHRISMIDMLPNQTFKHTVQHVEGRVYVGEDLPPIPQRMAKSIARGDFVEMEELLLELWLAAHQENKGKVKKNWKITDISHGPSVSHYI